MTVVIQAAHRLSVRLGGVAWALSANAFSGGCGRDGLAAFVPLVVVVVNSAWWGRLYGHSGRHPATGYIVVTIAWFELKMII